jgi:ribosome-binding factor A
MAKNRMEKINEEIKRCLGEIFREVKDPRIPHFTSVIGVKCTGDLKFAKVYVSFFTKGDKKKAVDALKSASGFIRHELSQKINLRNTPQLIFENDESIAYGAKISGILHSLDATNDDEETKNED